MFDTKTLGISFKYESRSLFRNVRPVEEILDDFKRNGIPHIHIDPVETKYGNWNLVVAFSRQENCELFKAGKLSLDDLWQSSNHSQQFSTNPQKTAKRAAVSG